MKNNKKYIIVSAVLASVILIFAVLLILYDRGYFDISFLKRPERADVTETETETGTETEEDTKDPDGTGAETDTEEEETADPSVFEDIRGMIPDAKDKKVSASESTYDKNTMTLYRLDKLELPDKAYYGDYMSRKRYIVTRDTVLRKITESTSMEIRRSVDVYMGMLVVSNGSDLSFYNGSGDLIYTYSGEEELIFAYERDKEDRALFILGDDYYYIDPGVMTLIRSEFVKADSRGFYYNYPTYFAKDAVKAKFWRYDDVAQRDENGIGSIYFDGGYVMVRNIKHEQDDEDRRVVEDMEIIVDEDGKEFSLPEGCVAKAYSDQRILVYNNGKYGFYAVKDAWIADTKYTYATPYYEGLAVVGSTMQKGVIDMEGNFVIPMSYSHISVCSGGIIVCWSEQTGYDVYIKTEK